MNAASAPQGPIFLAPLRTEAFAVRRGAKGAEVVRIGMGPVRATSARTRLEARTGEWAVVLLGFAGALSPSLRAGDLVVASACMASDEEGAVLLPDAPSVAQLLGAAALTGAVHLGPVLSTPRVVKGAAAREQAAARGAIAVDMESRWCAPLSRTHPFAVVRAVVDVPGHDVLSVATPAATWKAVRSLAKASAILRSWSPVKLENDCKVGDH